MFKLEEQKVIQTADGSIVRLVDVMGNDADIASAARTSYGKDGKVTTWADDFRLLNYLMRHHHTTPFEMAEVKFYLELPIDTMRQQVRHRTASINEYSTRYAPAIDNAAAIGFEREWRAQATSNKQGSAGIVTEWPAGWVYQRSLTATGEPTGTWELWDLSGTQAVLISENLPEGMTPRDFLSQREEDIQAEMRMVYEERLKFGVAREVARKDLPMSTFTRIYWKTNLHNFLHYLGLRRESHAQFEIREIANAMYELAKPHFPITIGAWEEWQFHAVRLGRSEMEALMRLLRIEYDGTQATLVEDLKEAYAGKWQSHHVSPEQAMRDSQMDEFIEKLGLGS